MMHPSKVPLFSTYSVLPNLTLCSEFDLRIMITYVPTHRHIHRTQSTEYGQHFLRTTFLDSWGLKT